MDYYQPRQISQSDCEISSNCGKIVNDKSVTQHNLDQSINQSIFIKFSGTTSLNVHDLDCLSTVAHKGHGNLFLLFPRNFKISTFPSLGLIFI